MITKKNVNKRLNPCSTGITFLTDLETIQIIITTVSLNPCSTGITFLTAIQEEFGVSLTEAS